MKKETDDKIPGNNSIPQPEILKVKAPSLKHKGNQRRQKNRNESLYERRMKEYKDVSTENKYLQKKKENVALKNFKASPPINRQKESKSKEALPNYQKNRLVSPDSTDRNTKDDKDLDDFIDEGIKNEQLFDNIQNFLENPQRKEQVFWKKYLKTKKKEKG